MRKIILLLLAFIIFGCSEKSDNPCVCNKYDINNDYLIPLAIGNYWIYQYSDNNGNEQNLEFRIIAKEDTKWKEFGIKNSYIVQVREDWFSILEYLFYYIQNDTLFVGKPDDDNGIYIQYYLPKNIVASSKIHDFFNAFYNNDSKIWEFKSDNEYFSIKFKKDIGIVSFENWYFDKFLQLIDYKIYN